jgi:predicted site-specific integrase-resolvase
MTLLTITEAAKLAHRQPMTIHRWIRAGLLQVADRDHRGRLLVEWEAVLAVERGTRERDTTGRALQAIDRA